MEKLVLIDGHSILNRAFYGVPDLTNSEGIHTNAVYGFLNIMFKILEEEQCDHLAVAFDLKEPTFRHKMYGDYKVTRKPMPEELREQVPLMKEVLQAMDIPILTLAGYEADDILGTVAKKMAARGVEVSVVSGDRDLLQLADERIKIRIPKTSRGATEVHDYYPEDVKREYQVTPAEFIDVKALMGDSSDNIPGVPSIGEKTATAIIAAYGTIENAYAHLEEIRPPRAKKALEEHYDMAQMSKELATICIDAPVEFSYEDAMVGNLYTPEAYQFMKRLEFKSILTRFGEGARGENALESRFRVVRSRKEGEQAAGEALRAERAGLQLILGDRSEEGQLSFFAGTDGNLEIGKKAAGPGKEAVALALCWGEENICCLAAGEELDSDWLAAKAREICMGTETWVLNLKEQLPFLGLEEDSLARDAGVAGYLLNPLKDSYGYDDLARDYLGMTVPSQADLLGKTSLAEAIRGGDEKGTACACYMGYTAFKAAPVLKGRLRETGMEALFETIEMPLIYSLHHMEEAGIHVEQRELKAYGDRLKVQIERLEKEIYRQVGEEFNINSPKQLGEILFDKMKLKGGKKTKTGYSTAADVLEKLAPDCPVVQMVLDYRQLTKLNSTYAEGLAAYIGADGRIHGKFNQTITATGRISSTEPNLQNIPVRMELGREIRKVFVAREGCTFVDADYSQIELRILAHMSGDERLIEAYREAQDIHAITASQVFHIPLDQVTPLQRRNAKAVNFGIVYGISAFGLSEGLSISRKEAMEYIEKYFETYPGVKKFLDGLVEQAKEQGYVSTLFGRRRPIPELNSPRTRAFGERVAMNSPIQGTAADIMKLAMVAVRERLRAELPEARLPQDPSPGEIKAEEVVRILEDKMKHAADLKVSLEVEAKTGRSWFDAK